MKYIKYLILGTVFGIVLTKAELISWFRIFEMFKFQAFHMYGVIGSAVVIGVIITRIIKATKMKSLSGDPIEMAPKTFSYPRYLIGGTIFGWDGHSQEHVQDLCLFKWVMDTWS